MPSSKQLVKILTGSQCDVLYRVQHAAQGAAGGGTSVGQAPQKHGPEQFCYPGRRSHWDETGGRESSPFVHCHTERPSPRAAWGPLGAGQAQAGRGGDRALPCVDPGNCRRARSGWWPGRSRPDVCERRRCRICACSHLTSWAVPEVTGRVFSDEVTHTSHHGMTVSRCHGRAQSPGPGSLTAGVGAGVEETDCTVCRPPHYEACSTGNRLEGAVVTALRWPGMPPAFAICTVLSRRNVERSLCRSLLT
ncbi:uncharacterized protein LOC129041002 [Pongo pygmaeus]|uniref:uncharacterized protein LOC129041002 n=1 Tax=Pongo pygmaeus TaxID=9600 RepID=UPI00300C3D72